MEKIGILAFRHYIPPMPPLAPDGVTGLQVLLRLGRNGMAAFPRRCLEEEVIPMRLPVPRLSLVLANGPAAAQQVLQTRPERYGRLRAGKRILQPIVGRGLLVSEGEAWRRQRRAMAPAFTPRTVPVLARHIAACADVAIRPLEAGGDAAVNLLEVMQRLALDVAASTMFAVETGSFGGEMRSMVSGFMAGVGRPTASDFFLPDGIPTLLGARRALFRRRWRRLIRSVIAARREVDGAGRDGAAPRDLFDLMDVAHGGQDDDLLADEVATMIVAGHETTALALFWACVLLAHAPEWQAAVAEEAVHADLTPEGAADALPGLTHARAVVQEATRLFPPAFLTARQALEADELCGVPVRAGSLVLVPFWMLHRNPRWWGPTADAFDPSRFLAGPEPARFTYLPFGAGPHVCIGAQLALTEAVLVLARLVRGMELTLADDRPVLPVGVLSTRPDHAPVFLVKPR